MSFKAELQKRVDNKPKSPCALTNFHEPHSFSPAQYDAEMLSRNITYSKRKIERYADAGLTECTLMVEDRTERKQLAAHWKTQGFQVRIRWWSIVIKVSWAINEFDKAKEVAA